MDFAIFGVALQIWTLVLSPSPWLGPHSRVGEAAMLLNARRTRGFLSTHREDPRVSN
jgi:hypothetical protein